MDAAKKPSNAELADKHDVNKTFKRFDLNRDGQITKHELAEIFKGIDPVYWDDERIESLMEVADTSRDGCIDYEEFIAWIFLEDEDWEEAQQAAQLGTGTQQVVRGVGSLVRNTRASSVKSRLLPVKLDMSAPHSKLGIKIDKSDGKSLRIKSIAEGGELANWNVANDSVNVCPGDTILSANGKGAGNIKALMKELQTARVLDLVIYHGDKKVEHTIRLQDSYDIDYHVIDEGRFSCIKRVTHKITKKEYAVKIIHKATMRSASIEEEISIMTRVSNHPHIASLYGVYEDSHDMYLVMELCKGGELLAQSLQEYHFSESEVARVMQQILSAVNHLHRHDVCHRDLNPQNFLLAERTTISECTLKLADFGFSRRCLKDGQFWRTKASDLYYFSPQMVEGSYDQQTDLWACGAIMYLLLAGYPPFAGETDGLTLDLVRRCVLAFPDEEWSHISGGAKDLIMKLLSYRSADRGTAEDAMDHSWVKSREGSVTRLSLTHSQKKMSQFCKYSKLKKAALNAMAMRLNDGDITKLKEWFSAFDKNSDGTITFHELHEGINSLGTSAAASEIRKIMEEVDIDGDGRIEYIEYLAATMDAKNQRDENICWSAFHAFDRDGSGQIGIDELAQVLANDGIREVLDSSTTAHPAMTQRDVTKIMEAFDKDHNGQIDFQEFMAMMNGGPEHEHL